MSARPNDSGMGDSGVHTGGESLERQTHATADRLVARGVVDVRTRVRSRVLDERQWRLIDRHVVAWRLARATDPAFVVDIAQICRVLEPIAAADAARHANPEQRVRITVASAARLTSTLLAGYAAARRELYVAILAASTNQFLQQLTCLVPPPDATADPDAGAPAISDGGPDGEHQALVLLEAAIHNGDPAAAHAGVERLNGLDLPRERDAYGHPESVGASA
ncbi:FadR family transcriptional regulator [Paraburkholderia sacchari]